MEIPSDRTWFSKYRWLMAVTGCLLIIVILFSSLAKGLISESSSTGNEISLTRVSEGTFESVIPVYGSLKPKKQRTLVSQSSGTLIEIRKRPGEGVSADTVVLVLSNPEVDNAVRKAKLEFQRAKADNAALEAELRDKKLTIKNERQLLQAEISTMKAELEALEVLAQDSIVSALDLKKTRMKLYQLELRLALAEQKEKSSGDAFSAQRASSELEVKQAEYLLQTQLEKQRALHVKAGMDGMLQSQDSSLALGQWLQQGDALGVVSGTDKLYAELNVNASDASKVQLGMSVRLNIRGQKMQGKVARIAPNANQNQVQVDVDIISPLPDIARTNLDIRGEIVTSQQQNAYLIPRPSNYREGQPLKLYVKDSRGRFVLTDIPVLEASSDQLALDRSFSLGSEILLNDPKEWGQRASISIEE